jgi:hypothetical protein
MATNQVVLSSTGRKMLCVSLSLPVRVGRVCGGIAEILAQPVHCSVEPMLEVAEAVPRPKLSLELFSRYQPSRIRGEHQQHVNRLTRELQPLTMLAQLARFGRQLERAEVN